MNFIADSGAIFTTFIPFPLHRLQIPPSCNKCFKQSFTPSWFVPCTWKTGSHDLDPQISCTCNKIMVIWDVAPCCLVRSSSHLEGSQCLHLHSQAAKNCQAWPWNWQHYNPSNYPVPLIHWHSITFQTASYIIMAMRTSISQSKGGLVAEPHSRRHSESNSV